MVMVVFGFCGSEGECQIIDRGSRTYCSRGVVGLDLAPRVRVACPAPWSLHVPSVLSVDIGNGRQLDRSSLDEKVRRGRKGRRLTHSDDEQAQGEEGRASQAHPCYPALRRPSRVMLVRRIG